MKCNQVLGTTIRVPSQRRAINVEWLCKAINLIYPVIHPKGQDLLRPYNYHSQLVSSRLNNTSKQVVDKTIVDDVLKYMIQFKHVCTCDIECNNNPCGVCTQTDYCGNCNCIGHCECVCQCQCECNETRNGNNIVCPCNCDVLNNQCVYHCACKCNCNCDCPCPCPCDCDCLGPCVGPTCDSDGKPKTECSNERAADGSIVTVTYCNSATIKTCDRDNKPIVTPANCGSNNCKPADNPISNDNSGGSVSNNDILTVMDRVSKEASDKITDGAGRGLNVSDNKNPTCTRDCTCNCGGECACVSSNCNSNCGSNSIKITGGLQRNCISFCPVINCDG